MHHQSCVFVGRITNKARLNFTQTGTAVANFDIAINRNSNSGQADFIPCVIWEEKGVH